MKYGISLESRPALSIGVERVSHKTKIKEGYELALGPGGRTGHDVSANEEFGATIQEGDYIIIVSSGQSVKVLARLGDRRSIQVNDEEIARSLDELDFRTSPK
jgi:hypothetical protein